MVRNFVVMSTNKKGLKLYLFLISPYRFCITLENKYLFGMIGVDWIYYQYHCWRTVISWYVLLLRGRNQISNRMPSICENTTILYYPRCNRMHNSVKSYKEKSEFRSGSNAFLSFCFKIKTKTRQTVQNVKISKGLGMHKR